MEKEREGKRECKPESGRAAEQWKGRAAKPSVKRSFREEIYESIAATSGLSGTLYPANSALLGCFRLQKQQAAHKRTIFDVFIPFKKGKLTLC